MNFGFLHSISVWMLTVIFLQCLLYLLTYCKFAVSVPQICILLHWEYKDCARFFQFFKILLQFIYGMCHHLCKLSKCDHRIAVFFDLKLHNIAKRTGFFFLQFFDCLCIKTFLTHRIRFQHDPASDSLHRRIETYYKTVASFDRNLFFQSELYQSLFSRSDLLLIQQNSTAEDLTRTRV